MAISDCSRDCIQKALDCLEIGDGGKEPGEFQLWVRTKLDESPYPLIGHEIPLVIKLHWMRQTFNNKNQKTYDEYRQGCHVHLSSGTLIINSLIFILLTHNWM